MARPFRAPPKLSIDHPLLLRPLNVVRIGVSAESVPERCYPPCRMPDLSSTAELVAHLAHLAHLGVGRCPRLRLVVASARQRAVGRSRYQGGRAARLTRQRVGQGTSAVRYVPQGTGQLPVHCLLPWRVGDQGHYQPLIAYWARRGHVCIQPSHSDSVQVGGQKGRRSDFRDWTNRP